jgi:hypothetical protein
VTCLRSPSSAPLELMIRSATCLGAYQETDSAGMRGWAAPTPEPSASPHFLQNLWVGAFAVPQAAQANASFAPHSGQKSASDGVSCWHRGHFRNTPTRLEPSSKCANAIASAEDGR